MDERQKYCNQRELTDKRRVSFRASAIQALNLRRGVTKLEVYDRIDSCMQLVAEEELGRCKLTEHRFALKDEQLDEVVNSQSRLCRSISLGVS